MASNEVNREESKPLASPQSRQVDAQKTSLFQGAKGWLLLFGHAILCIALALTIALAVNGYQAIDNSTSRQAGGGFRLHVSDVTTLVSTALVFVKLLVSSWSTIALWQCALFLRNMDPKRLSFMMSWRLPPWIKFPCKVPENKHSLVIGVVLLIILPQSFIAPLLSGSIDWESSSTLGDKKTIVSSVSPGADFSLWYWYNMGGNFHDQLLRRAAGYASLAWAANPAGTAANGTSITGNGCRHIVNDNGLPVNSTLYNATIPCIQVHNISWATSLGDLKQSDISFVIGDNSSDLSQVDDPPSQYWDPGVTVVFDANNLYKYSSNTDVLPNPTLFSGSQTIGLFLTRQNTAYPLCSHLNATAFGPGNQYDQYYNLHTYNSANQNCWLMGKIQFTAGVTISARSTYVSSRVVEDQTPIDEVIFEPNAWVQQALWLLPDLMTMVALMNSSLIPTWDNLDGYVETLLRQTYLAAWDVFYDAFDMNGVSLVAVPQEPRIKAEVSFVRVFTWLGVCLLMPLAGALLLSLRALQTETESSTEDIKADLGDMAYDLLQSI